MAQTIETTIYRYIVDTGTTKPTSASEIAAGRPAVPIGSLCWNYSTNIMYKTYDGTNWVVYVTCT